MPHRRGGSSGLRSCYAQPGGGGRRSDDDGADDLDEVPPTAEGDDDAPPEKASARKAFFPSSIGVSVLVPGDCAELAVEVAWGDYVRLEPKRSARAATEPADRGGALVRREKSLTSRGNGAAITTSTARS